MSKRNPTYTSTPSTRKKQTGITISRLYWYEQWILSSHFSSTKGHLLPPKTDHNVTIPNFTFSSSEIYLLHILPGIFRRSCYTYVQLHHQINETLQCIAFLSSCWPSTMSRYNYTTLHVVDVWSSAKFLNLLRNGYWLERIKRCRDTSILMRSEHGTIS